MEIGKSRHNLNFYEKNPNCSCFLSWIRVALLTSSSIAVAGGRGYTLPRPYAHSKQTSQRAIEEQFTRYIFIINNKLTTDQVSLSFGVKVVKQRPALLMERGSFVKKKSCLIKQFNQTWVWVLLKTKYMKWLSLNIMNKYALLSTYCAWTLF